MGGCGDLEGKPCFFAVAYESKCLGRRGNDPVGGSVEIQFPVGPGAGGGDFYGHVFGGARSEEFEFIRKAKRDRRNNRQPPMRLSRGGAGDQLHRFVGDHDGLATHLKNKFDREGRRIFRLADQGGLIDPEHAGGALAAQPIGLGDKCG